MTAYASAGLGRLGALLRSTRHFILRLSSGRVVRRILSNRAAVVAGSLLLLFLVACIVGPFFVDDPTIIHLNNRFADPSSDNILGTDHLGRDLLARLLSGGRVSFLVAIGATIAGLLPSLALGLAAGYFGGRVDEAVSRFIDVLLTIPTLLLAIIVVAVLGPSLPSLVVAIAIGDIPRYARLVRAITLEVKDREYVLSAVALGYSSFRVMLRHVLPNVYVPVIVIATGNMGRVALSEASLSFLGAGIQPPNASWGNMIAESQRFLQYSPLLAVIPGVALSAVTIGFSFLGDGLRDALDIREPSEVAR
jgi:peptide/nickel transport system permease protein